MSEKVASQRRRSKAAAVSRAQRRRHQRAVQAEIQQGVAQVVQTAVEAALEAEVTERLGRGRYARRHSAPARSVGAVCGRCRMDWTWRSYRAGQRFDLLYYGLRRDEWLARR